MIVAMCDEFLEISLQAGREREIPSFMARDLGNSPGAWEWFRRRGAEWEDRGQPVFDHCQVVTRRGDALDHLDFVADVFDRLPAGLSCVLLHPAIDTLEIRSVTSDWRGRVADFEAFRQPSLREHIRDLGIDLISYRPIWHAMRRRPQAGSTWVGRRPSTTQGPAAKAASMRLGESTSAFAEKPVTTDPVRCTDNMAGTSEGPA
jgi:hypothetical protein